MTSKNLYRCQRSNKDELYQQYHDRERGVPVHDDAIHFEFLLLETFQAWLSRYTILKKRENFRHAFDHFDYKRITLYQDEKVVELMNNAWIIRNKAKINATIINAQVFIAIQKEFGSWDKYIWWFTDNQTISHTIISSKETISCNELSDTISIDLKKRGMKFVWSTVIYAHLQATWQINDHEENCWKKHLC